MLLPHEASELYQRGFEDLRRTVAARCAGTSAGDLVAAVTAAGLPCQVSQGRDELVLLLALSEWGDDSGRHGLPQLAEDAARRGVSLVPEE
ncbi:hypothetical protein LV779_21925 [Streptomyces thinghirensis]|nr:hypothetical protein [Streptomyces thinghirensis]